MRHNIVTVLGIIAVYAAFFATDVMGQETATVVEPSPQPFGEPDLDLGATGRWWDYVKSPGAISYVKHMGIDVPRDQTVAFALYTHDHGVLKLTAQLYPLKPGESSVVRLELCRNGVWTEAARKKVVYPGWTAHFRLEQWDANQTVPYRVCHGDNAFFEGKIRRDPTDKEEIVAAVMSCNGSHDVRENPNANTVASLKKLDPDVLFFVGDQHYRHSEHTAGWLNFGQDFREILRDRPVVAITDDHDVGHGNLWGEGGKKAHTSGASDGGYKLPPAYVNMVQRQQMWHLPDPFDATPIERGITVHYTRLRVGGVDFIILEDRKFKSGPAGKIPMFGGRPDHINTLDFDPKSIDLPGLKLLGDHQSEFLRKWSEDWTGAEIKAAVSQTAFCGAVHIHGSYQHYLRADLDCNGWPQGRRDDVLRQLRSVQAAHLCGDQHLAVVVKHGIDNNADGPYAFTGPALWNSIYRRWWKPRDEKPGDDPVKGSPLRWTGNYRDGLGNRIRMLAYANPPFARTLTRDQRADGFAIARFNKENRTITFECWPRQANVADGDKAQFPGWPITFPIADNDGRKPTGWLPQLNFETANPVVQVINETTGEILYCLRIQGKSFRPPVFGPGRYTVKAGNNKPENVILSGAIPK